MSPTPLISPPTAATAAATTTAAAAAATPAIPSVLHAYKAHTHVTHAQYILSRSTSTQMSSTATFMHQQT